MAEQVFLQKRLLGGSTVRVIRVPQPSVDECDVLIRVRFSLISTGTELAAARRGAAEAIAARIRDQTQRAEALRLVRRMGIRGTLGVVREKLLARDPTGYSGCGTVVAVGSRVDGVAVGDLVAYAGSPHASTVRAGKNLVVRVPPGVQPDDAAAVAVGAIALHAVRRAEIQVGDVVAVFGLGLVGQLVAQIARAAGAYVLGIDPLPERRSLAQKLGASAVSPPHAVHPLQSTNLPTKAVDKAIVCAAGGGSDIYAKAAAILRDRGTIVAVGAVPLELPRELFYYKEIDLRLSRSYGPGRYDPSYEQHGISYPRGYIRWTERENMAEFLRLVATGKVQVRPLVARTFKVSEAAAAYEFLQRATPRPVAVLLDFMDAEAHSRHSSGPRLDGSISQRAETGRICVGIVGASHIVRRIHLPNMARHPRVTVRKLLSTTPEAYAQLIGRLTQGVELISDARELLEDRDINVILVANRDKQHAGWVLRAVEHGKHVYCEKPIATSCEECLRLLSALESSTVKCTVGFNRRCAPLAQEAVRRFQEAADRPLLVEYVVCTGGLARDRWIFDPRWGAGPIVGEACHFIDFARWVFDANPVVVSGTRLGEPVPDHLVQDLFVQLHFPEGRSATIRYCSESPGDFAKERVVLRGERTVVEIRDFESLRVLAPERLEKTLRVQDKGHGAFLAAFVDAVAGSGPLVCNWEDGLWASVLALLALRSARLGYPIGVPGDLRGAIEQVHRLS